MEKGKEKENKNEALLERTELLREEMEKRNRGKEREGERGRKIEEEKERRQKPSPSLQIGPSPLTIQSLLEPLGLHIAHYRPRKEILSLSDRVQR